MYETQGPSQVLSYSASMMLLVWHFGTGIVLNTNHMISFCWHRNYFLIACLTYCLDINHSFREK